MILTHCAWCAEPLGLSLGKKCGRCSTRYCGAACQVQHWKEGGHDKLCKKIKKAGGAEQYNANKKYAKAVTVAVEKCADDTKGQTCFICTQALHWKTKEGLVRMCACRGTAGFAHVSCLAEQVKILVAEAEENNLIGTERFDERWARWHTCGLCEQQYHGVVACALGWACWKTYVGRPETDQLRMPAMSLLANGLSAAKHLEDSVSVMEAELSMARRFRTSEERILITQSNLANAYGLIGRRQEALRIRAAVYSEELKLHGEENERTLTAANNYASSLKNLSHFGDAKALIRRTVPLARRVLGEGHSITLKMRKIYAIALCKDNAATLDDLREAVTTLEDIAPTARRVFGVAHPLTVGIKNDVREALNVLSAREESDVRRAMAAMAPPST